MENNDFHNPSNPDVEDTIRRYSEETLWNLSLADSFNFPVTLGAGNPTLFQPGLLAGQDFSDEPDGVWIKPNTNTYKASNNQGQLNPPLKHGREFSRQCNTIVLHWTGGGSAQGAISTLKSRGLSYHAIIDRNGSTTQCVPFECVAYHAGESFGPQGHYVNSYSIGISFVNIGAENGDYPDAQRYAAYELINKLKSTHPLVYITGHVHVAPHRKRDPIDFPFSEAVGATGLKFWKPNKYIRPPVGMVKK